MIAASCRRRGVGGDRDDERPAVPPAPPTGRGGPGSAASSRRSARGVPGATLSPIASAPGGDRGERALGVGDAADLDERPAGDVREVVRSAAGGDERGGSGRRVGGPDQRLADERAVEPERTPAGDGRRLADARLGDDEPVVRDELAEPSPRARRRPRASAGRGC